MTCSSWWRALGYVGGVLVGLMILMLAAIDPSRACA